MIFRICIDKKDNSEVRVIEKRLKSFGYAVTLFISNVYTLNHDFSNEQLTKIAKALHNPVVETYRINTPIKEKFDFALELGFLPGVTDNIANTTTEIIEDLLKTKIPRNKVFTSKVLFLSGNIKYQDVETIAKELINILIERYHIKSYDEYIKNNGMDKIIPAVKLKQKQKAIDVDLNISDEKLIEIGKKGIFDPISKSFRGPLALDLEYMHAIQNYFKKEGRNPTDIELESIAQTWSEHCKHTIFADPIDDIKEGIFKKFIKGATDKIRQDLGEKDFCVSVFKDNSGGIIFDEDYIITDKVETHNTPSALDPFGGAITGIVGVNRDTIGFGMGALPIANKYGFCIGYPEDKNIIYRAKNQKSNILSPKRILNGIIEGVNVGGNCSGIPTPTGFVFFDNCYKGKPLVFVGTIGILPKKLPTGQLSYKKKAMPGDNIVVIGGRVGKDGIHGATFSSEAIDEGSPATAVQIGDPITQKKFSDAVVKEARDRGLFNSITDNGAGGLSSSVGEMAKECGGFIVNLEKIPLKYPGLQPWETWISESQERMTLSVPNIHLEEFQTLMEQRGVESTVIGKFNNSDKAKVKFHDETIFNLKMDFLHNGLPKKHLHTKPYQYNQNEPNITVTNHKELLLKILSDHNNCSFEFISKQYDHEVQNNSVIKPLQGKGRVNGDASVIKPLFTSKKGVVLSQSMYPRLSNINCYDMAACSIDNAIRNCVAVGGDIDNLALLDNFCWCSSNEPERLDQLKDAAKACYDYAIMYKTPFISGKDSMFNDFKGFDKNSNPLKISVLPTLLISGTGVINDITKTNTMDFKIVDDLIYLIGKTKDECGGSDFYNSYNEIGSKSPKIENNRELYKAIYELSQKELLSACASIGQEGFLVKLSKMSIAGQLGCTINLKNLNIPLDKFFYSITGGRFIVTIDPTNKEEFEKTLQNFNIFPIGQVKTDMFTIKYNDKTIINIDIKNLTQAYKERFSKW